MNLIFSPLVLYSGCKHPEDGGEPKVGQACVRTGRLLIIQILSDIILFFCTTLILQVSPKVPVEQQDEKKLIGFAQLSVIHDKI